MNNEEKILEILQQVQADVSGLKADVAELKVVQAAQTERLDRIEKNQKQHTRILRQHTEKLDEFQTCIDTLIDWADDAQVVVKIPFAKGS